MQHISAITRLTLGLVMLMATASLAWAQNKPSESKTGSVLVFPYYTSNFDASADTLMNISNLGASSVAVHLYFIDGSTCQQADTGAFLTPNATLSLKASFDIALETGYLVVVAVDQNGCVVQNGGLTGSAFVKAPAGYFGPGSGEVRGNYSALAFNAYQSICPAGGDITLNFNGVALDAMPSGFAVSVQNLTTAPGQTVVMAGLNGSISDGVLTGAAQLSSGGAYSANEAFRSFANTFLTGACQSVSTLSVTNPRVIGVNGLGLGGLIAPGTTGLLRFNTAGGAGLLITPRNNAGWSGIRNLTCTSTRAVTLRVPAF